MFFEEYKQMSVGDGFGFGLGIAASIFGVYILSQRAASSTVVETAAADQIAAVSDSGSDEDADHKRLLPPMRKHSSASPRGPRRAKAYSLSDTITFIPSPYTAVWSEDMDSTLEESGLALSEVPGPAGDTDFVLSIDSSTSEESTDSSNGSSGGHVVSSQ